MRESRVKDRASAGRSNPCVMNLRQAPSLAIDTRIGIGAKFIQLPLGHQRGVDLERAVDPLAPDDHRTERADLVEIDVAAVVPKRIERHARPGIAGARIGCEPDGAVHWLNRTVSRTASMVASSSPYATCRDSAKCLGIPVAARSTRVVASAFPALHLSVRQR